MTDAENTFAIWQEMIRTHPNQSLDTSFPNSPILHYVFSSWIEKTMTKTIHFHWENIFVFYNSMELCGNLTDTLISPTVLSNIWQFAAFSTSKQLGKLQNSRTKICLSNRHSYISPRGIKERFSLN